MLELCWWQLTNQLCHHPRENLLPPPTTEKRKKWKYIYMCNARIVLCWWQLTNRLCHHSRENPLQQKKEIKWMYMYVCNALVVLVAVDKSIGPTSSGKSTAATCNRKKEIKWNVYIHMQCFNCADGSWQVDWAHIFGKIYCRHQQQKIK